MITDHIKTNKLKLFILNSKPVDPNGYIFQALIRALCRRSDIEVKVVQRNELRQINVDPGNQSLLVYGGEELHQIPNDLIKHPFGVRAVWFTEDPYESKRNSINAELFQVVFTNDSGSLHMYKKGRHLPLAGDLELIPKQIIEDPKKLLFFSGTAWPNRKRLLDSLLEKWPRPEDLDIHLVANRFVEQQLNSQKLSEHLSFENPIAISDFCLRAANSLCTLVIGRDFSGSGKNQYAKTPGPRLFEAGVTGSCQLVHDEEIRDMPKIFQEGVHYLRFSTTNQLVDLLHQAEGNPEPFRVIGRAMAEEIKTKHTYDQRAATIVESIRECKHEISTSKPQIRLCRALFISHEQTKAGFQHGGAGLCLDQIVESAPKDVDIRILCRSGDEGQHFDLLDRSGHRVKTIHCSQKVNEFSLHHPELESKIEAILKDWQPQIVHINHLLGFTPAIVQIAREQGALTTITLHDFYTICDSWNLLNEQNKFCNIDRFFFNRCQSCCASRRPQFNSVDPERRRVAMSEALARANAIIVPSRSTEVQIRKVMPHIPRTHIIEPVVKSSAVQIKPGEGSKLIALVPGNMAINKGYLKLRKIIEESNSLGLPIEFRILGRVEKWIREELNEFPNIELLGSYNKTNFAEKASGSDVALFLSPWPETYCITFDEWKLTGLACIYHKIGALAEPHRQRGLHRASLGVSIDDENGVINALINASTPNGLRKLRTLNERAIERTKDKDFGLQHWSLFEDILSSTPRSYSPCWTKRDYQKWVEDTQIQLPMPTRKRLKQLIYKIPGGHRLAPLWRKVRGR